MTYTAPASARRPRLLPALFVLAMAHFTLSVDFNVVYIALPEIGRELGLDAGGLQWVVSAFALGYGGFLLLGGRAVDRLGARRMLVLGAALMAGASVVGALVGVLTWPPTVLIGARAAQGFGAALIFPATLALVNTAFDAGPARNRALAVWGSAGAFGALAGGALGGVLTSLLGWASIFWALVPLALVVAIAAPRVLPTDPRSEGLAGFDLPGSALATGGALLLVFGISRIQEDVRTGVGVIVLGAVTLGLFLLVERGGADPLLPLGLLRVRSLWVSAVLVFVLMGVIGALHFVYTTHVQDGLGLGPLAAGLGFLPQGVVAMLGSAFLLPRLLGRWGSRRILFVGVLGVAVTSVVFAWAVSGDHYWMVLPAVLLLGLTAGTVYPAVFAVAGEEVDAARQGVASATVSTAQQLGGAVGLAALVAVAGTGGGLTAASLTGGAALTVVAFLALAIRVAPRAGRATRLT
ncbi:MFS transporter [Nocardiopsis sp. NPDC055879]